MPRHRANLLFGTCIVAMACGPNPTEISVSCADDHAEGAGSRVWATKDGDAFAIHETSYGRGVDATVTRWSGDLDEAEWNALVGIVRMNRLHRWEPKFKEKRQSHCVACTVSIDGQSTDYCPGDLDGEDLGRPLVTALRAAASNAKGD